MHWKRVATISAILFVAAAGLLSSPFIAASLRIALRPAETAARSYSPVMAFRHIGFGDLDTCTSASYPMIERSDEGRASTFIVRASVACGLEVRNPTAMIQGDTLHLGYETHLVDGMDMCDCEYRSVFSVADLPAAVYKVEFDETFVDSAP
jgi:hypothetical protein